MRRDKGFTLIELLVVLTIIGFIAVIARPNWGAAGRGVEVRTSLETAAAAARLARTRAISDGQETDFSCDLAEGVCTSRRLDRTWALGAELDVSGEGAFAVTFYGDGSARGGVWAAQVNGRRAALRVNPVTGRVSAELP